METLLGQYLRERGAKRVDFAREHGFKAPMVSQWAHGERRPGLALALAIEKATGGVVPASYWPTIETATERARKGPKRSRATRPRKRSA